MKADTPKQPDDFPPNVPEQRDRQPVNRSKPSGWL